MRIPARFISGQLIWTHKGSVWAAWRVEPRTYAYLSTREKLQLHGRVRAALMNSGAESMLLSLCERVATDWLVDAMTEGLDIERMPDWQKVVGVTQEAAANVQLYRRCHFLVILLPATNTGTAARSILDSAKAAVGQSFGLPAPAVRDAEIAARQHQADHITQQLRPLLAVDPATPGELRWIYARAPRRALDEPSYDESWELGRSGTQAKGASLVGLGDAIFKEGGDKGDLHRPRKHRRYLKVETEAGTAFQTFLTVADMPQRFYFPGGGEWFAQAEGLGFPVDWCARIRSIPNADAQVKTKRQARQLVGQVGEYEGEPAGPPQSLATASEAIDHQRAELAANPADPELQTTIIFSVWSDTLAELESRADQLRAAYEIQEYGLPRPTGGQLSLYEAMLPGSAIPPVCRDYTQFLLPRDLAAGMPFAGTEVGDPRGMLLGVSLDGGTAQPVLFDPAYGPSVNRSGSLGAFGALGSGKSYFIKCVAWSTLARGGQVVVLDRTVMGEYVHFARVVPGKAQVVRLAADSQVCLDPLRVFPREERVRYTIGFLTLLTGTSPTDLDGAALAEAVRRVAERPDARLTDVIDALQHEATANANPDADIVYRKLRNFSRGDLARLAFGDGDILTLDADYIVFHLPGLSLPDKEVLENPHLARQLLPEQIFSQALLYLVAATARTVTFAEQRRFAAALIDEAWALTSNLQGRQLLLDGIRDGRKHNAAVWLLSQHPSDLGEKRLSDLLGNRFVFHQSRSSAQLALEFLEMESSEATVQMLETSLGAGQCLYRDVRNRIGLIQVLEAPLPGLHEAFDTNPASVSERDRRNRAKQNGHGPAHPHPPANGHRTPNGQAPPAAHPSELAVWPAEEALPAAHDDRPRQPVAT